MRRNTRTYVHTYLRNTHIRMYLYIIIDLHSHAPVKTFIHMYAQVHLLIAVCGCGKQVGMVKIFALKSW